MGKKSNKNKKKGPAPPKVVASQDVEVEEEEEEVLELSKPATSNSNDNNVEQPESSLDQDLAKTQHQSEGVKSSLFDDFVPSPSVPEPNDEVETNLDSVNSETLNVEKEGSSISDAPDFAAETNPVSINPSRKESDEVEEDDDAALLEQAEKELLFKVQQRLSGGSQDFEEFGTTRDEFDELLLEAEKKAFEEEVRKTSPTKATLPPLSESLEDDFQFAGDTPAPKQNAAPPEHGVELDDDDSILEGLKKELEARAQKRLSNASSDPLLESPLQDSDELGMLIMEAEKEVEDQVRQTLESDVQHPLGDVHAVKVKNISEKDKSQGSSNVVSRTKLERSASGTGSKPADEDTSVIAALQKARTSDLKQIDALSEKVSILEELLKSSQGEIAQMQVQLDVSKNRENDAATKLQTLQRLSDSSLQQLESVKSSKGLEIRSLQNQLNDLEDRLVLEKNTEINALNAKLVDLERRLLREKSEEVDRLNSLLRTKEQSLSAEKENLRIDLNGQLAEKDDKILQLTSEIEGIKESMSGDLVGVTQVWETKLADLAAKFAEEREKLETEHKASIEEAESLFNEEYNRMKSEFSSQKAEDESLFQEQIATLEDGFKAERLSLNREIERLKLSLSGAEDALEDANRSHLDRKILEENQKTIQLLTEKLEIANAKKPEQPQAAHPAPAVDTSSFKVEIARLEALLSVAQNEKLSVEAKLSTSNNQFLDQISELKAKILAESSHSLERKKKVDSLEKELGSLKAQLETEQASSKNEIKALNTQIKTLKKAKKEEKEKEKAAPPPPPTISQERERELLAQIDSLNSRIVKLQREKAMEAANFLTMSHQGTIDLETTIDRQKNEIESLKRSLEEATRSSLSSHSQLQRDLQSKLFDSDSQIQKMRVQHAQELQAVQYKLDASQQTVSEQQKLLSSLQGQLSQLETQFTMLHTTNTLLHQQQTVRPPEQSLFSNEEVKAAVAAKIEAEAELDKIKKELATLKKKVKKEKDALEAELSTLKEQHMTNDMNNMDLASQLQTVKEQAASLQAALDKANGTIATFTSEEVESENPNVEIAKLKQFVSSYKSEVRTLKAFKDTAQDTIDELTDVAKMWEAKFSDLHAFVGDSGELRKTISLQQARMQFLEGELERGREKLGAELSSKTRLEAELRGLEMELAQAKRRTEAAERSRMSLEQTLKRASHTYQGPSYHESLFGSQPSIPQGSSLIFNSSQITDPEKDSQAFATMTNVIKTSKLKLAEAEQKAKELQEENTALKIKLAELVETNTSLAGVTHEEVTLLIRHLETATSQAALIAKNPIVPSNGQGSQPEPTPSLLHSSHVSYHPVTQAPLVRSSSPAQPSTDPFAFLKEQEQRLQNAHLNAPSSQYFSQFSSAPPLSVPSSFSTLSSLNSYLGPQPSPFNTQPPFSTQAPLTSVSANPRFSPSVSRKTEPNYAEFAPTTSYSTGPTLPSSMLFDDPTTKFRDESLPSMSKADMLKARLAELAGPMVTSTLPSTSTFDTDRVASRSPFPSYEKTEPVVVASSEPTMPKPPPPSSEGGSHSVDELIKLHTHVVTASSPSSSPLLSRKYPAEGSSSPLPSRLQHSISVPETSHSPSPGRHASPSKTLSPSPSRTSDTESPRVPGKLATGLLQKLTNAVPALSAHNGEYMQVIRDKRAAKHTSDDEAEDDAWSDHEDHEEPTKPSPSGGKVPPPVKPKPAKPFPPNELIAAPSLTPQFPKPRGSFSRRLPSRKKADGTNDEDADNSLFEYSTSDA